MKRIFIRGLLTVTPLAITIALIVWIFTALENVFRKPIQTVVGQYYFPGLGVLIALVIIFFIGIIINNFLIQKIYSWAENVLKHIPLVKTLYNSVSDLMGFFRSGTKEELGQVVLLNISGFSLIGFITREKFEDLDNKLGGEEEIAVYVPFSYQIGGYTFIVNRSQTKPLDMTVDQAMRFAITAGVLKEKKGKKIK